MPRIQNIWTQLVRQAFKVEVDIKEAPYGTTRYTPNLQGDRDDYEGNQDQFVDFPYVEDPTDYQTYKAMEHDTSDKDEDKDEDIKEQEMPEHPDEPEEAKAVGAEAELGAEVGGEIGGEIGGEMGGLGGFGEEEKQTLTSSEIGKVYELKKIYSRLTSLESHLSSTTDVSLLTMRGMVAQSMDLFETVIVNFEQYKEQINEIIVMFYKFLDLTYEILRSYYKNDAKNEY